MMRTSIRALLGVAALATLPSIISARPLLASVHKRAADLKDEYDYIIVGGGTAGLTVADRLTADGKCMLLPQRSPRVCC
jgi:choline dehydrogenase